MTSVCLFCVLASCVIWWKLIDDIRFVNIFIGRRANANRNALIMIYINVHSTYLLLFCCKLNCKMC